MDKSTGMGRNRKSIVVILTVILAISSILLVNSVSAQTTPKPSVPEFTLKYVDGSYDVPTTYTIDQYTGETITHQGYHVNLTVFEMVIQNQLNPINDLYYSIQVKGHYSNEWIMFFDYSEGLPLQDSTAKETIIRMGTLDRGVLTLQGAHKSIPIPSGGKEDIQVQALVGSIGRNASAPMAPYIFNGVVSDWSPTQTITIPESNTLSPSPTFPSASPTPTPTVPELSWLVILPLLLSLFFVVVVIRHRKTANSKKVAN